MFERFDVTCGYHAFDLANRQKQNGFVWSLHFKQHPSFLISYFPHIVLIFVLIITWPPIKALYITQLPFFRLCYLGLRGLYILRLS